MPRSKSGDGGRWRVEFSTAVERPVGWSYVVAVSLAVCVVLVSVPAIGNGFVNLDDSLYVGSSPMAHGITPSGLVFAFTSVTRLYWHPLAWISHQLDAELYSMNPTGHHVTSVLLQGISVGLLFMMLHRIGTGLWAAALGSVLWAVHPLRVESFAWIAERKDVLCALFVIATVWAYLRYTEQPSSRRYAAWLCFGALALMSKPAAVTLPLLLLLLDYWPSRRTASWARLIGEKLPLAAMSGVVTYLTVLGQVRSGSTSYYADVPLVTRLANAAVSYARYLGKLVWPVDLACFYPYRTDWPIAVVAAAVILLAAITAGALAQRKRRPWLLVGWLWFVIAVLPNAGLMQAGRQAMADRFTHLGSIGLAVAVVWSAIDWAGSNQQRRKHLAYAGGALVLVLSALTVRQIGFWHDSEILFRHAVSVEDSGYMRGNLAEVLLKENRVAEAETELRKAQRLSPDRSEYRNNLAALLLSQGRIEEAAAETAVAVRLDPNRLPVMQTAGLVALRKRDVGHALVYFDRAVKLGGELGPIAVKLNDAGASLAASRRFVDAEALIRRAISLSPALVQARRNLVLVLLDSGRKAEARAALESAVRATGDGPPYRDLWRETE